MGIFAALILLSSIAFIIILPREIQRRKLVDKYSPKRISRSQARQTREWLEVHRKKSVMQEQIKEATKPFTERYDKVRREATGMGYGPSSTLSQGRERADYIFSGMGTNIHPDISRMANRRRELLPVINSTEPQVDALLEFVSVMVVVYAYSVATDQVRRSLEGVPIHPATISQEYQIPFESARSYELHRLVKDAAELEQFHHRYLEAVDRIKKKWS